MGFENRYSRMDRTIHRFAFRFRSAQLGLADLEDQLFKRELEPIKLDKPVFITGLPRSGTTLLLELCVNSGEFASHTYRDMPFVLTPMLWHRLSGTLKRNNTAQERAHGDGMLVAVDSPEALEEILWLACWQSHYQADHIAPWEAEEQHPEFGSLLSSHCRKIIALRSENQNYRRYISKNNLNIARLKLLRRTVPGSRYILPFRDPLSHAQSLLRQHRNFLDIHHRDSFAAQYMAGIGHFDFGQNLRPVNFDNWLQTARFTDPMVLEFWLEYWCACYRHLLDQIGDNCHLVSYEALCREPTRGLQSLAQTLALKRPEALLEQADRLNPPTPVAAESSGVDTALLAEARALSRELAAASIV